MKSSHDVSAGGLIVALSEMTFGSKIGIKINKPKKLGNFNEYLFGEDQGRYILEIDKRNISKVEKELKINNIYYENLGTTQENFLEIERETKISLNDLFEINNQWYNNY